MKFGKCCTADKEMAKTVITGMGVVSNAGLTLDAYWRSLLTGQLIYGPLPWLENDPQFRVKIGAYITSSKWNENLPVSILSRYGKAACYSASAALRAIEDAEFDIQTMDTRRIAIVIGTTMGEIQTEEQIAKALKKDPQYDNPQLFRQYRSDNILQAVRDVTGAQGRGYVVPAACAAGNYALALAQRLLHWNEADLVITGGVDAFSMVAFAGFQRLLSLAPDSCRPFDRNRRGLVLGEGCGMLLLERERERNSQKIHGYIKGIGLASNAYHMTSPHPEGRGEKAAMEKALQNAALPKEKIDCVIAHGTGTKANDRIESIAIQQVFGQQSPYVCSVKSMLGHSMGAASTLEVIAGMLMMQKGYLLPTANYETRDPDCDLKILKGNPVRKNLSYIQCNSFAFGGQTSSVIIGVKP